MMKTMGGVFAAILLAGAVAGCQDTTTPDGVGQPSSGTTAPGSAPDTGASTGAKPTETSVTVEVGGGGVPATAGKGRCVDLNSAVVNSAITSLGPSVGGDAYIVDSATDAAVGSCPELLWVLAATPRGTASSPYHVLFFNNDGYLGTATSKATSYTSVVGSSDRDVQVRYRWLTGNDANCCPSGGPLVITYTLGSDGRTVTPDQTIPDEIANP